jgi:hypothetical protein
MMILIATSFLDKLKMDTRWTCNITRTDVGLERICDMGYGGICVVTTITNL